jgi:hypothetical protein
MEQYRHEELVRAICIEFRDKSFRLNAQEVRKEVRSAHSESRNNRNAVWAVGHAMCALRTVHEENQA